MTLLAEKNSPVVVGPALGGQLPSLTGMRWMAAFLVFVYHVRNFGYFGGEGGRLVDWAFGAGSAGVSFFFILSGFVLAWTAREGDSARVFWLRRLARVYPVHLVTALLALTLSLTLVPALSPSGTSETLANLLLVSSWKRDWWQALNPVSWSLTCEAFFYATFPALYAALRRIGPRSLTAVAVVSGALVIVLPWANIHYAPDWILASFPAARLPEFVLGAALGRLVRLGAWRGPGLDVSLALTVVGYFLTRQLPGAYGPAACTIVGLGLLIPAAAVADLRGLPSFWRRRRLVVLGEWSFAFYMIHILVMRVAERLFVSRPHLPALQALPSAAAVFLVSLGLAWALYTAVEQPARRVLLGSRRRTAARPARAEG
ncbi:macrolide O-acyltransferase [Streptomyces hygroscopicus]|uniref:acyltransferase family protein n=1 Tax=Streptomyces hygroscopicus TaxID=1912 RepID=UPI00223F70C2|nr:acyltransferase [Streptomyces hygroscopicus]MCW7945106.1 macrolide O-acyltransferase [Streptomyces hygroscopicus]